MKKVEVTVLPHQVEIAKEAILRGGASGMTMSEVASWSRLRSGAAGGLEHASGPGVKLELVVHDDLLDRVVDNLLRALQQRRPVDGEILASGVDEALRIRTGEVDEAAVG